MAAKRQESNRLYVSGGCGQEHEVSQGSVDCPECRDVMKRAGFDLPEDWRSQG